MQNEKPSLGAIRRSNRFRVLMDLPLKIGWKDGTLVDISEVGVLATHTGVLKVGASTELSFQYGGKRFAATATVQTCTVVGLGAGPGGATLYASRVTFASLTDEAREILRTVLGG